jgi:hypothetical protein
MKETITMRLLAEVWVALFPNVTPEGTVEQCADIMRNEIYRLQEKDWKNQITFPKGEIVK